MTLCATASRLGSKSSTEIGAQWHQQTVSLVAQRFRFLESKNFKILREQLTKKQTALWKKKKLRQDV